MTQFRVRTAHRTSPFNRGDNHSAERADGPGAGIAGAVDQANSSCVSCHRGAYAAPPLYLNIQGVTILVIISFPGMCDEHNAANAAYLSDYQYPQTFGTKQ